MTSSCIFISHWAFTHLHEILPTLASGNQSTSEWNKTFHSHDRMICPSHNNWARVFSTQVLQTSFGNCRTNSLLKRHIFLPLPSVWCHINPVQPVADLETSIGASMKGTLFQLELPRMIRCDFPWRHESSVQAFSMSRNEHIEAEAKWPSFCRRNFLMYFLEWKLFSIE